MLRFGKAQPFVFERRVVFPCKERSNFHEAVVGRNYPKLTTFPILGRKKRISQRPIPSKSPARRSATTVAQLKHYAEEVSERAESEDRANSVSSSIETPSSTYSGLRSGKNVRGSVGNNLLQRVVRLQDELARKNHEIDELRRQRSQYFEDPSSSFKQNSYRLPHLSETLSSVERNFELEAYRSLIAMVAAKVRSFNDVVLRSRHRSYSDVFSAFINITEKPISQKLFEIEKECDVELARKGFSAMQRAHLADFFRRNGRDEILSVAGEIEILVPIIRNACATAEESILVCNVFTQWSRQLADQIRVEGLTGMQLLDAIDKLKENFYREHMENHWLLPSISPLLSLTAYELEKTRENSSTETNGGTQAGMLL